MRAMARVSPAEPDRRGLRVPGARDHDPTSSRGTVDSWRSSGTRGSHKRARTMLLSRVDLGKVEKHNLSWRERWYGSSVAASCRKGIRSRAFSCVAIVCLFCALFLYDTCVLLQVPSNVELDVVLTLVLLVFLSEFLGLALTESTYPGGFFFWMDLIGTLSMLFDISYLLGADATSPERVSEASANENVALARAARTARLGARAGRLTRVLKVLRFLPFLYTRKDGSGKVKVAHAISSRLNTVLAQRVAFLTIGIVVTMPVLNMFQHPETDRSFTSWAKLLARNVEEVLASSGGAAEAAVRVRMDSELQRFSDFYKDLNYGPYKVCHGDGSGCQPDGPDVLALAFSSPFEEPVRRASIQEVVVSDFHAFYDMSVVAALESAANMASIVLVVAVMLVFGLLMSNNISVVVLVPLERMLSVVRGHCKQIFKFAAGIQEDDGEPVDEGEEKTDGNEFQLLEDVIGKLAGIAALSTKKSQPRITKDMREEDIIQLNWMQGGAAPKFSSFSGRQGSTPSEHDMGPRTLSGSMPRQSDTGIVDNIPSEVLVSLDTSHCNVLEWDKKRQLGVCECIFTCKGGCAEWVCVHVESQTLHNFIAAVEQGYPPNLFHNFSHGVDVLCSVARFLQLIEAGGFLDEVSQYLLLIAALSHDVGHLGVNNQFLMETSHELTLKYNDRSPMEMLHCSKLFHIVRDPSCNIFHKVDKDLYKDMRKTIIDGILHTDMSHHFSMVNDLGLLYQLNSDAFDQLTPGTVVKDSPQTVQTVLNALLHCADISNPMKPWELCHRIAYMVLDEFFAQGDKERELGVPVQFLNDRAKVNRPNSQVGFIEFVIAPMCEACVHLFPQLNGLAGNLACNIARWSDMWEAEASPEQAEIDKVTARVQKVVLRCEGLRHRRYSIH